MLLPRRPVPELRVPTLAHGDFDLSADAPKLFTLISFYRGLHCPVCRMRYPAYVVKAPLIHSRDSFSLWPEVDLAACQSAPAGSNTSQFWTDHR